MEYYSDRGVAYCELHHFQASQEQCQASPALALVTQEALAKRVLQAGRKTPGGFFILRETAERYGVKVSKQQRNWFIDLETRPAQWAAPFPQDQLVYMVQDIEVPHRPAEQQQSHLARQELEKVVQLENEALPALASMEVHGVLNLSQRSSWGTPGSKSEVSLANS